MTKFRLAASYKGHGRSSGKRPARPRWIDTCPNNHSREYWQNIYWATPPWLADEMISEMKWFYENRPPGYHVDHIVPLKSNLVCGLHVPWNLQWLPASSNISKSNDMWPGHPCENLMLDFPDFHPQMEMKL